MSEGEQIDVTDANNIPAPPEEVEAPRLEKAYLPGLKLPDGSRGRDEPAQRTVMPYRWDQLAMLKKRAESSMRPAPEVLCEILDVAFGWHGVHQNKWLEVRAEELAEAVALQNRNWQND